jgi:hypothetical protein
LRATPFARFAACAAVGRDLKVLDRNPAVRLDQQSATTTTTAATIAGRLEAEARASTTTGAAQEGLQLRRTGERAANRFELGRGTPPASWSLTVAARGESTQT